MTALGKGELLKTFSLFLLSAACCFAQANVPLGVAASFAVLGASTVTSTGTTAITGNVGVSPGTAITGLLPAAVTQGSIHYDDSVAMQAHTDLVTAYGDAAGQVSPPANDLTGTNLGGLVLTPGVYHFDTSAFLDGTLTLNGAGYYIFQIGTTLTTGSSSVVAAINGADAATIFWQVGSSATLGTSSVFIGSILADQSVTATTTAVVAGRLLALVGAVTMDTNTINYPPGIPAGGLGGAPLPSVTPVPSSWILLLIGLACVMLYETRERWLSRFKNG
jgi:hypothetical protein